MMATENAPAFLTLDKVCKSYSIGRDSLPIFTGVDLEIKRGEFIAVMGPSGSGKSTLLNLLAGLDRPDSGQIHVGGRRLDNLGETAQAAWRAQNVGIVFQFYNLLPMLNAAENIELPLLLKPLSAAERRKRVKKVLNLVGLGERGRQKPSRMSGGQQQRVGIARAIVTDPDLLLCDEPTGDLDRKSADEILSMLSFLNVELGKTIVMVTHDPEAARQSGRILHLDKGVFVEDIKVAA